MENKTLLFHLKEAHFFINLSFFYSYRIIDYEIMSDFFSYIDRLHTLTCQLKEMNQALVMENTLNPKTKIMVQYASEWLGKKQWKSPGHEHKVLYLVIASTISTEYRWPLW